MSATLDTMPSLTLRRRLKASPAKVFAAWTEPATLARWFSPAGADCIGAEIDASVGGRYAISMRTADGEEHHVGGVFREIVPVERLVLTWTWRATSEPESLVTVTFAPDGSGTLLTLTHERFADVAARDSHNEGWSGALDKLVALFAGASFRERTAR